MDGEEVGGSKSESIANIEAASMVDAADKTADSDVIDHLWERTRHRLEEEKGRQDGARDRAGKYITYAFSILAGTGGVLAISSELVKNVWVSECWAPFIFGALVLTIAFILYCVYRIMDCATDVLKSAEYKTWSVDDLKRVDLGGKDSEFAYSRYLLKAAWRMIPHNAGVNEQKIGLADDSLRYFKRASFAAIVFIIEIMFTNVIVGQKLASSGSADAKERSSNQALLRELIETVSKRGFLIEPKKDESQMTTQGPGGNQPKPNVKPPTPTPTPSPGEPLRKSIPPSPTPMPGPGRPMNEGNEKPGK